VTRQTSRGLGLILTTRSARPPLDLFPQSLAELRYNSVVGRLLRPRSCPDSGPLAARRAISLCKSARKLRRPNGSIDRFQIELDELLGVGSVFTQFTSTYEVTSIVPGSDDSVGAEARIVSGPGQQVSA